MQEKRVNGKTGKNEGIKMEGIERLEEKSKESSVSSICQNGYGIINITFEDGTEFEIYAKDFNSDLEVVKLP